MLRQAQESRDIKATRQAALLEGKDAESLYVKKINQEEDEKRFKSTCKFSTMSKTSV